jgi:hypothetical protein
MVDRPGAIPCFVHLPNDALQVPNGVDAEVDDHFLLMPPLAVFLKFGKKPCPRNGEHSPDHDAPEELAC